METAIDTHEEQETAPKQPNKWITKAKEISKVLFDLSAHFLLIVVAAGAAFLISGSHIVAMITATTVYCGYTIMLNYTRDTNTDTEAFIIIRNFLGWLGLAAVVLTATSFLHEKANQDGPIVWSVLMSLSCIVTLLVYFDERNTRYSFMENITDYYTFRKILLFGLAFVTADLVYTDWATQWVWIPLALYSIHAYTFDNRRLKFSEDMVNVPVVICGILGIVSTICQFFFANLFTVLGFTIKLWFVLSVLAGIAIVIFAIKRWFKYTKDKAYAAQEAIKTQERDAAKAEKDRIAAEERQRKYNLDLQICSQLKEKLEQAENPSWKEIMKLSNLVDELRMLDDCKVSEKTVSKGSLLEFFTVSEEKKQIAWNYSDLRFALSKLSTIADKSLDDANLKGMKRQIGELDKFSGYRGYQELAKQVTEFVYLSRHLITQPTQ